MVKKNNRPVLKLYVWEGVLTDYTDGIMFALAENVKQARQLLLKRCSWLPEEDLRKMPKVVKTPRAFHVWGGG